MVDFWSELRVADALDRDPDPRSCCAAADRRGVSHLCRAQGDWPDAAAQGAECGWALWPAAALRRRLKLCPRKPSFRTVRTGRVPDGADADFHLAMIGWAVIPFERRLGAVRISMSACFTVCDQFARRLRHHHGRLGIELEISVLGRLRSAAQMVSYEVSIGFVLITVLLCVGSLNLSGYRAGTEETSGSSFRCLPMFDLCSDLHAGGDQPRALRSAGSRSGTGCRLQCRVFGDGLRALLPGRIRQHGPDERHDGHSVPGWLAAAVRYCDLHLGAGYCLVLRSRCRHLLRVPWVRATFPRYRYDQLMRLGWKVFLPLSLLGSF